jgi:hypothetical protein
MRDYVTFAKPSNHLDLKQGTRLLRTTVGFGAVVENIELSLLMLWSLNGFLTSQVKSAKTKGMSTASAYVTSGSRREFSQSFHSIDLFPLRAFGDLIDI